MQGDTKQGVVAAANSAVEPLLCTPSRASRATADAAHTGRVQVKSIDNNAIPDGPWPRHKAEKTRCRRPKRTAHGPCRRSERRG